MGRERARVLAVAANDPVMSILAPVALAATAGTALIVDLGDAMGRKGARTLADLVDDGPTRAEATPERRGVAVLRSGGLDGSLAEELVQGLAAGWSAVVVRLAGQEWTGPVAPVYPLYPGVLAPKVDRPAVWQRVRGGSSVPGPGPVMPPVGALNIHRVLAGAMPLPGRWLRSWRVVWRLPWA